MSNTSLEFGDVFEFNGKEYIFLAPTIDVIYVAKVLPTDVSEELNHFCAPKIGKNNPLTDSELFCFIMLTTEEIKDRAAQFGKPELEDYKAAFHKLPVVLNKTDLNNLRAGILSSTKALPGALLKLIEDITI